MTRYDSNLAISLHKTLIYYVIKNFQLILVFHNAPMEWCRVRHD